LADALLHQEGAPCTISPFVVDGLRLFVVEGGEGEDFGGGIVNDFKECFARDTVELVFEVKEHSCVGR